MDVCELQQPPPPLTAEKNNGPPFATSRRTRIGEASYRYKSPTSTITSPVVSCGYRRCSSPTTITKSSTSSNEHISVSNRAVSTERRRSSPPPKSTPRKDTAAEYHYRKGTISNNKLATESLWPSTMRNLNVSFQSESKEKLLNHHGIMMDRNSSPSSCAANANAIQKKKKKPIETTTTPASLRMRSPLKGKNEVSENSRPVVVTADGVGKISSNAVKRGSDIITDKATRSLSLLQPRINGVCSSRRLSLDNNMSKPSQKPGMMKNTSFDDNSVIVADGRAKQSDHGARSLSLGSSPNKVSMSSSSFVSRGISPYRPKTSSHVPSRGLSPLRSRTSSPLRQSNPTTSVLSFIADIKKGKKGASHIEDVHQLRMLYNRHLQWRYANDQADVSQHLQVEKAERTLFNAWCTTSDLLHSVTERRMELLQMKLHSKLCSVINAQMMYLDVWDSIEKDHTQSLIRAIKDLQSCTLRLPVTGRARGDSRTVKAAICSALGVFQAMGSSIGILLSQMEKMYSLVSEVANVAAQERAMLDECEALLGSTLAMQVEEDSLRIHLVQFKEGS